MTGNTNNQEHNQERDAALSALYRAGEQHEPPDHIEDEILAAARKEVRAGPRRRSLVPTSSPWFIPMATAAVLVLSVSVVFLARQQTPELVESTRVAKRSMPSEPFATTKPAAPQSVFDEPIESLAILQESNSAPPRTMEEERLRSNNDIAAESALADSAAVAGAKMKQADEPRVARFIGSKREAAGVSSSPSEPVPAYKTPDDWLKEIARLQHVGEKQLAEAELKRFQESNKNMTQTEIKVKLAQFRRALGEK